MRQHLESVIEANEKWNGADIRVRQERVLEIDLEQRGMRVSALEVRLPKQENEGSDADEHEHRPQEKTRTPFHEPPSACWSTSQHDSVHLSIVNMYLSFFGVLLIRFAGAS